MPKKNTMIRGIAVVLLFSLGNGFAPLSNRFHFHPTLHNKNRNVLRVSSSPDQTSVSNEAVEDEPRKDLDMPWSDFQQWALRDNLAKYVVSIPTKKGDTELYALWRTMTREVTELSGYTTEMLQEMHARDEKSPLNVTPKVLPLLDEFEFESAGGLSGRVYGIAGVADGTKIETTAVKDMHVTVPKGYVQTEDGAVAYELGLPLRDLYSLDGTSGKKAVQAISKTIGSAASGLVEGTGPVEDPDTMLVRLGVSTGVLLAGATAMSMLSHHLTVNVFWV